MANQKLAVGFILICLGAECFCGLSWPYNALFGASPYAGCTSPSEDSGCPYDSVTFYLYRNDGPKDGVRVDVHRIETFAEAGFDPRDPVKLLIHGYSGHRDYDPNPQVRPAYLKHGKYNVFSVDWSPLAKEPCYFSAAKSVPTVGKCAATLVDAISVAGVPPEKVHIVGFSLGSHVSGYASKKATVGKVGRITGLDPALPMFASTFDEPVLDPSDAIFVDIIHTNAGNKGKLGPNGHVDFYANGGFMQPGCDSSKVFDRHSCSHSRAAELFGESIGSQEGFWGTPCGDWMDRLMGRCAGKGGKQQLMGEHVDTSIRGMYFIQTNDAPPFAMGSS